MQWCLVDRLVLQRGGEGHVHKRPDLLEHHLPPAWVAQNLAVLVDLFLKEEEEEDEKEEEVMPNGVEEPGKEKEK